MLGDRAKILPAEAVSQEQELKPLPDRAPLLQLVAPIFTLIVVFTLSVLSASIPIYKFSRKSPSLIDPADFTHSIWVLIYFWQLLWIIYVVYLTRKLRVPVMTWRIYLGYNLSNVLNCVWISCLETRAYRVSGWFVLAVVVSLFVTTMWTHKHFCAREQQEWFKSTFSKPRRKTLIGLVVNGITAYFTWVVVLFWINWANILHECMHWGAESSASLSLAGLSLTMALYWILEFGGNTSKLLRFTFSVYPVLLWALGGILAKQGVTGKNPFSSYVLVYEIALVLFCMAKILKTERLTSSKRFFQVQVDNSFQL